MGTYKKLATISAFTQTAMLAVVLLLGISLTWNPIVTADTTTPGTTTSPTSTDPNAVTLPKVDPKADPALKGSGTGGGLYQNYLNPFIAFLSAAVGIVVVISIIAGAIQYSSSAGDPQKVAAARIRIRNSIVALVAFIFLWAFIQWLVPGGLGG